MNGPDCGCALPTGAAAASSPECERAETLLRDNISVRDVAEETGMSKSAVHRIKQQLDREAKADG